MMRRIARLVRNLALDLRYGGFLGGTVLTVHSDQGAYNVSNTDYAVLPYILRPVVTRDDILVDVGCGKGRVINWCLANDVAKRIIGIELDPDIARATARRLSRFGERVQIMRGNVLDFVPPEGDVFYLFNPFTADVLQQFRDKLAQIGKKGVRVIYYNPVHKNVFADDRRWKIEDIELPSLREFHRCCVITLRADA
jgi:SAM-dependent methyltransferase